MATSKTTNTYNRQNWEDAVSNLSLFDNHNFFKIYFIYQLLFFYVGVSNFMPDMFGRQSLHQNGKL